jgi:hypothetical protein
MTTVFLFCSDIANDHFDSFCIAALEIFALFNALFRSHIDGLLHEAGVTSGDLGCHWIRLTHPLHFPVLHSSFLSDQLATT